MPDPSAFATCRTCGDAVPPELSMCPTCGASASIPAREEDRLVGGARRRFRTLKLGRIVVVSAVAVGLAAVLIQAAFSSPPVAADPLTQSGTFTVTPGNFTTLSGDIVGADWIQGNYTVVDPPGAALTFAVFNATEFTRFSEGDPQAQPALTLTPGPTGRIVFPALVTDLYFFVWENHYPMGSGLSLTFYVKTVYESNVQLG